MFIETDLRSKPFPAYPKRKVGNRRDSVDNSLGLSIVRTGDRPLVSVIHTRPLIAGRSDAPFRDQSTARRYARISIEPVTTEVRDSYPHHPHHYDDYETTTGNFTCTATHIDRTIPICVYIEIP